MPDLDIIEYANQITCIDTHYQRPELAACYLLESEGEAVFIDTGTSLTVPYLMDVLAAKGIQASQVKYVIPTHVHLDHAGGLFYHQDLIMLRFQLCDKRRMQRKRLSHLIEIKAALVIR